MGTVAIVVLAGLSAALALILVRASAARARMARSFAVLESVAAVGERDLAVESTLQEITEALVPAVADFCVIDVIVEGRPLRAAVRVGPGGPPGIEEGLSRRTPSLPVETVVGSVDAPPVARLRRDLSEADLEKLAHDPGDRAFLRRIGMRSFVILPLRARGRTTGALTLAVAWSGRRYGTETARFFRVLKGRVSLALDNAGLFSDLGRAERARAEIAETLQRGLLPPPLPHIPGWSAAAMYRPAGAENEVGGDFYDAFPVADGWMVVVGDVTGRGARAASITGQARYTLRTAASLTGDPLVALATLNRALLGRRDSALCTVAAFTLPEDPTQPVRLAVAGHPPPMLVVGESVVETVASGPLLGAFEDVEWSLQRLRVEAGQLLVVITDGVTEAPGPRGRFGEERLRSLLATTPSPVAVVQRLEGAMHEFTEGRFVDDAAILALARTADERGAGADRSFGDLHPLVA
ncbi:MAG TPA: SpoIIE family protein phosphatase [Solirubrobacterales bacterium]|nr:SpoIIE family protein phosphatase [Solirubrobacterales bacterium]